MPERTRFTVRLTEPSLRDFAEITEWTLREFGHDAMLRYEDLILCAILDLEDDPGRIGAKEQHDLQKGLRTYHLALSRERARSSLGIVKNPRHMILYRLEGRRIEVLRILHDAQDLSRHVAGVA